MTNAESLPKDGHFSAFLAVFSLIAIATASELYLGMQGFSLLVLPWLLGCFATVGLMGRLVVPILRAIKAGQFIREDGPQAHLKKSGTPTMGGIYVVPVGIVAALLGTGAMSAAVVSACVLTIAFGFIGWLDDWQILRKRSNKGISPQMKLALQGICAGAFCVWLCLSQSWQEVTTIHLPWGITLPLGIWFIPLALFVILGSTNATNLTDGLDGLAGGTGAIALMGMAVLVFPKDSQLALFAVCMAGSYLGFLWHNRHPAQVFMGDTGSLALGGALSAVALAGDMLWGFLIVGLLFVWESISVIAQVGYYKATKNEQGVGQRLFKMAPYHHHLELSGWHETQVVLVFYAVAIALVILAIYLSQFSPRLIAP
jgi:phospho-N-acetylmuramoyl-pentapeptide-transferase